MKKVKIQKVKIEKLKLDKAMLQKQIEELRKLLTKNIDVNEELEQYDRRLCLQTDKVPIEKGET